MFFIYNLYKHENIKNGKIYIGITAKNPIIRWNEGYGYKSNKKFYPDIQEFGWEEGFTHEVLLTGLSKEEAVVREAELILKYDSVRSGYNLRYADKKSLLPDHILEKIKEIQINEQKKYSKNVFHSKDFDMYDFKIFNTTNFSYKSNKLYFTRIPNCFIQTDIQHYFGVNKILLFIYYEIDKNRSYEDTSYICIKDIFDKCKYKIGKTRPKIFYEILKCLLFLKENNYIECDFNPHRIGYEDRIKINVINEVFDPKDHFTKLYRYQMDFICNSKINLTKESILHVFLYINSYIGCRSLKDNGTEYENAKDHPGAFYKSIKNMSEELAMSKDTINKCIEFLTTSSETHNALLIKREVGSIHPDKNKPPQNVPNIYVLNREGYEKEIEWALEKMYELYHVTEFQPFTTGNHTKKNDMKPISKRE